MLGSRSTKEARWLDHVDRGGQRDGQGADHTLGGEATGKSWFSSGLQGKSRVGLLGFYKKDGGNYS